MKPFNLQEALAGKPVVTRLGLRVRQLSCFDAARTPYPLFGVRDGVICNWDRQGMIQTGVSHPDDLFMYEEPKAILVTWFNLYENSGFIGTAFASREEALRQRNPGSFAGPTNKPLLCLIYDPNTAKFSAIIETL